MIYNVLTFTLTIPKWFDLSSILALCRIIFLADEFQTVTYKKQSNGNNGNIKKDNNDDYNKWKKEKDKRLRTGFRSQKYENSIYTKKKKKKLFCIHSIVGLIVMPTVKSLYPFT